MAKKKEPTKLEGVIADAVRRLKIAQESSEDNRKRAKDAIKFRDLEQWPDQIKKDRENDPDGARPCLTLDKINQYVNQVKNDERQNRPSIKVRPVDDAGDVKVAEIYQGIIRDIEDCSSADAAYDTGFEHAADGGFGFWRIVTEYTDPMSFDQAPRIKRISNRFSVELDPYFLEADGSDRKWGLVFERVPKEEFESLYPGKKVASFAEYADLAPDWCGDEILVAEYFRIEEKPIEIALLPDGSIVKSDEVPEGVVPVQTRKTTESICKWSKLTCAEELESRDFPSRFIPIVEVVGNELDYEGKRKLSGMIRGAMDSMRMFNYSASAFVEMVALAPRAPWVLAEGQAEGREAEWKSANRRNISALQYKPVLEGDVLVPSPQRQPMPGIPSGWQQAMQNFEHDIQASMGMYAADIGEQGNEKSGRAILARQKAGDTATFHYVDNLSRAIRFTGRILIDIIQRTYDTARLTRILKEDGTTDQVRLDPDQEEAIKQITGVDGKSVSYYNLTVGKYDVTVSAGPSYTTKRQEGAEWMLQLIQATPELMNVIGDLVFKIVDMPYADKVAERLKKMLPPNLADPPEDTNLPPEVAQAIQQAEAQLQQREQMLQQKEQGLAQVGDAANQEIQQAKDAKSALEKEALELKSAKEALKQSELLINAKLDLKGAQEELQVEKFKSEIRDAQVALEKAVLAKQDADKQVQVEGETSANAELMNQLVQSHSELTQLVHGLTQAISAPRVKKSRVVGPSGRVFEHSSIETLMPEQTETAQ